MRVIKHYIYIKATKTNKQATTATTTTTNTIPPQKQQHNTEPPKQQQNKSANHPNPNHHLPNEREPGYLMRILLTAYIRQAHFLLRGHRAVHVFNHICYSGTDSSTYHLLVTHTLTHTHIHTRARAHTLTHTTTHIVTHTHTHTHTHTCL